MKNLALILVFNLLFSSLVKASELFCTGGGGDNNNTSISIQKMPELKREQAAQAIFQSSYEYVSPKSISCSLQNANTPNVIYSLSFEQGEIQLVAYDPMLTFINVSLLEQPNEISAQNRIIEIYTKSLSMPAYDLLASITISKQQNLGQYISVRYSHLSKIPEPQNVIVVWNANKSSTLINIRNILKIEYMHPAYKNTE
ncbi:hypothetical protein [uncultured Thiothrix sp.]|uniref:hypothetical protein n=1 Tax=uncultured Thiothrix sp. TaxID=223185 RepID=UPI00261F2776|nr:hypothetical protein [uncultured Thiothrix sp.]